MSAPSKPESTVLPRILGPFDAVAVVVGSIIGSGVFLKASSIAETLGPYGFWPIIAVWIVVGLVTLCGAFALSELAAMLPHAGGPYVYLREAYGRLWAFLWGWTEFWIIRTGSLGALACATVIYASSLLETLELQKLLPAAVEAYVPLTHWSQCALSLVLVLFCTVVNVIGTRQAAWVQNITALVKVGFLVFLIVGPFLLLRIDSSNLWTRLQANAPDNSWFAFSYAIGIAMIAVLWPYDGWINIGPVAEEIREPQRNVPLALTVGMLIVIAVYVGANTIYHLVLPMDKVAASDAVATDVTRSMLGNAGGWVAALCVMFSTLGALNSNLLCGPRIYFAMARDGLFPAAIRQVHPRFRTPANAIIAQSLWATILIVVAFAWTYWAPGGTLLSETKVSSPGDAFDVLTDFVIFGGSIFYAMAVGAVFVLRWRRPELPRPYKTFGYPFTPALYLLAFGAALVALVWGKLIPTLAGSVLILLGVVVFFLARGTASAASRID